MSQHLAMGGTAGRLIQTVGGLSKKFLRMSEVYRMFANDWKDCCNFGDDMLIELYNSESYGTRVTQRNGFSVGKKWLNLNVSMWKEDIERGNLQVWELYEDPKFPHWWLDSVFKK